MKKITVIVLVVLLILLGAVFYVTYSAADSFVNKIELGDFLKSPSS